MSEMSVGMDKLQHINGVMEGKVDKMKDKVLSLKAKIYHQELINEEIRGMANNESLVLMKKHQEAN